MEIDSYSVAEVSPDCVIVETDERKRHPEDDSMNVNKQTKNDDSL